MSKVILVLGGARSGKSRYAVELARQFNQKTVFIATYQPDLDKDKKCSDGTVIVSPSIEHNNEIVKQDNVNVKDEEMRQRIEEHRKNRPQEWLTVEEGKNIETVISNLKGLSNIVIIDCLTLLVSNLILTETPAEMLKHKIKDIIRAVVEVDVTAIIVSNEVGGGVVPDTPLGREFRDVAGWANQIIAEKADEVYLMVAGIPLKIKGEQQQ